MWKVSKRGSNWKSLSRKTEEVKQSAGPKHGCGCWAVPKALWNLIVRKSRSTVLCYKCLADSGKARS